VAANANWVPEWTLLAVTVSIRSLSSSATKDSDGAKEDAPSVHSSTKSWTRAAEDHRSSSSASTSRHATYFAPSRPVASSSCWSASRAQSEGGPAIMSQTIAPGLSRHERYSCCF
jgi:hypothetical protein